MRLRIERFTINRDRGLKLPDVGLANVLLDDVDKEFETWARASCATLMTATCTCGRAEARRVTSTLRTARCGPAWLG